MSEFAQMKPVAIRRYIAEHYLENGEGVAVLDPLAMYVLYARVGQSATHLASTSIMAINVRFFFFIVQVVIYAIWVVQLLG